MDQLGLTKEADVIDNAMRKLALSPYASNLSLSNRGADFEKRVTNPQDPYAGYSTTPAKPGIATRGKPGGDPAAKIKGFLYASPRSIAEFNDTLSGLFGSAPVLSRLVPGDVKSNLPSGGTWSNNTQKAFSTLAKILRKPEAAANWEKYANANNYEPTMKGILKFWEDNKQAVITAMLNELQEQAAASSAAIKMDEKQEGDLSGMKGIEWGSDTGSSAAGAAGAPIVKNPIRWNSEDLWRDATFQNNDPLNLQAWHISKDDKEMLAIMFATDPVIQKVVKESMDRDPKASKEELMRSDSRLMTAVSSWYRSKLKDLGIEGYYPARPASGDKDPKPAPIPAGASEPPVTRFDPARAEALNKGVISR